MGKAPSESRTIEHHSPPSSSPCAFFSFTSTHWVRLITLYFSSASNRCLHRMYKLCVVALLKSDQFCRCLAISTWSFPQRALEWPRILGAVPSVGSRALATQASETKPRSCVTSNLRKMGKKLSFALRCCRWCCKPIFLSYFSSPKTFWSLV